MKITNETLIRITEGHVEMMISTLVTVQKEICRMLNHNLDLNRHGLNGDLVELAAFVGRTSPFEVVKEEMGGPWIIRNKRTLKPIGQGPEGPGHAV